MGSEMCIRDRIITATKALIITTTSMTATPPPTIVMKLLTKMITRIRGTQFVESG